MSHGINFLLFSAPELLQLIFSPSVSIKFMSFLKKENKPKWLKHFYYLSSNIMTRLLTLVATCKSNIIHLPFLCTELMVRFFIHLSWVFFTFLRVSITSGKLTSQHCTSSRELINEKNHSACSACVFALTQSWNNLSFPRALQIHRSHLCSFCATFFTAFIWFAYPCASATNVGYWA